ncbi:hypothetical protein NM688_g3475 [Phlebia brevispora]|uniref:Uncharacterized protein n=1 Tax=Phlebia brevispora TaxID=194682 RepID=A0ACC1T5U8_9APHY|nr:hypothetical protein NM688_g3475 [Phlebia brevispora]
MGNLVSSPVVSDPRVYATEVTGEGSKDQEYRTYDYVIVGGGAAGCVLASRLSEDRDVTVLLVEAGSNYGTNLFSLIPFPFVKTFHTSIDWAFETAYEIIGTISYTFADVTQSTEDAEWSSDRLVQSYFNKAEGYRPSPEYPEIKPSDRGSSGPWITGHYSTPLAPVCQAAHKSCVNLGIPDLPDANTAQGTSGVVDFLANVDSSGRRVSTATAYLTKEVYARPNLTVAVNAHVDKILFEGASGEESPRAVGIEISTTPSSPRYRVRAGREVILSAGAVCSPKLLLLSGVGPAADLRKLDIPVVKDLPAGQYLSDHIGSGSLRFRAKPGVTWDYLRSPLSGLAALLKWYILGTGPFSTLCVPSAAFIRSDDSKLPLVLDTSNLPVKDMSSGAGVPDTEILWAPATVAGPGLEDPPAGSTGMTMLAINLRPESTGSITLKSKDPWAKPVIDPNYFASESDLNVVVRAVRFTQHLARTEPLASLLAPRPELTDRKTNIFWVGDVDPDKVTDDELKEFVKENSLPEYHPISSCRMGVDPSTSVVDTELKVHGIKGLRVVDASVFPTQVTGHPLAPIVAVAERASDLIKQSPSTQPATSISKVVAQPLQGTPLRSAVEGLPIVQLPDDQRSVFSTNDMTKEQRVEESSTEQSPQHREEVDRNSEHIESKENIEGSIPHTDSISAGTDTPDPHIGVNPDSVTSGLLPVPQPDLPTPSHLPEPMPPMNPPVPTPPASSRRSWFSTLSRSRVKEVTKGDNTADIQTSKANSEAAAALASQSGTEPQADSQARADPITPTSTDDALSQRASVSPSSVAPVLTASSSIDDEVPPLPPTPQIVQGASLVRDNVSSTSVMAKEEQLKAEDTSQRERALSVSSLNPSTSRFTLRIPLLGRPKVPLEQAIAQTAKAEASEARLAADTNGNHQQANETCDTGSAAEQISQPADVPEVKVMLPSPPPSSETLAESTVKPPEDASAAASTPDLVSPSAETSVEVSSSESVVQTQFEPKPENTPPVPSSSSWWGYIGWSSSTSASAVTLVAQQDLSAADAKDTPSMDTSAPLVIEDNGNGGQSDLMPSTAVPEDSQVQFPAADTAESQTSPTGASTQQPAAEGGQVQATDESKPAAPSILSAETSKTQGSAWYSPWSWYISSPLVPQSATGNENIADVTPEQGKTESEMVKEEALARDEQPPTAPEAQVESSQTVPAPQEIPLSTPLPLSTTNPIEASISIDRSGWSSFFVSKALSLRGVWDSDANKLRDRPENEGGMEVMNIDEDDEEHLDRDGEQELAMPSTSKAITIVGSRHAVPSSSSVPSSPTPVTAVSPVLKEREPKKSGPPSAPLTNSEAVKKEVSKRPASPAPSTTTGKKPGSGTSTPQPKAAPANLVLPTWKDTFLSPPRSLVPPQPTPPATQRGRLGKTLEFMSEMLFPDADKGKSKGKERERARSWDRDTEREKGYLAFGTELPKALEVLEQTFDTDTLNEKCRVVVIGVAGWSPGAVTRTIAGGLPSSSSKFVNMTCAALEKFEEDHGFKFQKISRIPLEGDGTIDRKVSKVHSHLLGNEEWMADLHAADVIFVAAHSQGCIVATHLLDRLIRDGHILTPRNADIVASTAAAVAPGGAQPVSGPLRYLRTSSLLQPYIQYFENAAARELFEFQNTESTASQDYIRALRTVMDHGAKMVYVASLNDQVVPIYSGLFTAASHPRILRALYIDGDAYHSSDFLSNLLVLLIRITNSGLSDSGLLAHLSEATAGTLSGVGHSTAYEELATYSLAVDYLFLTNDGPDVRADLLVEPFNAVNEQNDYEIPWSLRDLIADDRVARFFAQEFAQLRDAFDDWSPKTSILRDVKRKLQPIQRLSTIRGSAFASRL